MTNRKLNLSKVFRKLKFGKDLDLRVSPPGGGGGVSAEISLLKGWSANPLPNFSTST